MRKVFEAILAAAAPARYNLGMHTVPAGVALPFKVYYGPNPNHIEDGHPVVGCLGFNLAYTASSAIDGRYLSLCPQFHQRYRPLSAIKCKLTGVWASLYGEFMLHFVPILFRTVSHF